jgi:hypothetical protein
VSRKEGIYLLAYLSSMLVWSYLNDSTAVSDAKETVLCWVRFDLADQLKGPPCHAKSYSDGEQSIHDAADRRRSCRVIFAAAPS